MKKNTSFQSVKGGVDGRNWLLVDAANTPLGRLSSEVAQLLRGKHKPTFTPHVDMGDYIVVVNAEKIALSGKKETDKIYYSHSGYVGGLKERSAGKIRSEKPDWLIRRSVAGMLPKGSLGRSIMTKLKVYSGEEHPHAAQSPVPVTLPCQRRPEAAA